MLVLLNQIPLQMGGGLLDYQVVIQITLWKYSGRSHYLWWAEQTIYGWIDYP
jgi:hypothetical protein